MIGACNGWSACIRLCGCLTKGGGTFQIVHPNPSKKGKWLHHSFTEAPTRGDNLYRWSINVSDREHSIELPDYYKYLNENSTVKISPVGHFGRAYGKIDENQDNLIICADQDGSYNILLMGTRCDEFALKGWHGVEQDMNERNKLDFGYASPIISRDQQIKRDREEKKEQIKREQEKQKKR
jgi:hypothetical protein